jgi:hypothetical protein
MESALKWPEFWRRNEEVGVVVQGSAACMEDGTPVSEMLHADSDK